MSALAMTFSDTLVLARRNLKRIPRQPDLLIAYTVQPVMFVLLFVYVFGGAIVTPGFDYVDFLMPGIIAQSIAFGGFVTALGLSEDVQKGLIDRFRSLPMSRAAVLTGRTFSDILLNCLSLVVLFSVGFIAGFNFVGASAGEIALGIFLLLLHRVRVLLDLRSGRALSRRHPRPRTPSASRPSSRSPSLRRCSCPPSRCPMALRQVAEANPFTTITDALRSLWLDTPPHSDIWMAFVWCGVLIAIFAPLAVARYRRVSAR